MIVLILITSDREPPRVLKPKHLSDEQSRSWRPMIGMTHSNQRGRLDTSGHRTLSYVYKLLTLNCCFNITQLCYTYFS